MAYLNESSFLVVMALTIGLAMAQKIGPGPDYYWPIAQVPYDIDANFSPENRQSLQRAIDVDHQKTCIRWTPRNGEAAYVHFKNVNNGCAYSDNCYYSNQVRHASFVGCKNCDTMVHEMGHILCFGHEQDRIDRDDYIDTSKCFGGGKYDHLNFGHLYDYRSIMHYGADGSCAKMPGVTGMGSNNGLSVLDAEKINDVYNCKGCLSYRFRFPDQITASSNPVVGGADGAMTLYPCRAYINGEIAPGKAILGANPACWVSYNGQEQGMDTRFEILTNPENANLRWVRSSGLPDNAIAGGRTADGVTLYVARCLTLNGVNLVTPGKMYATRTNVVYAAYGGREVECTNWEILVC